MNSVNERGVGGGHAIYCRSYGVYKKHEKNNCSGTQRLKVVGRI